MAYILIDGYNLIGISHQDFEKARNGLIKDLQQYAALKKHIITIVFDGWKSGQKDQSRIRAGHVTTIFTRLGENADTVIKKMLLPGAKPWIVVSSDREISDHAFRKGFAAVHSEEFEFKLLKTLRSVRPAGATYDEMPLEEEIKKYYDDEAEESYTRPKGNPRKMSKRDKIKLQALRKL